MIDELRSHLDQDKLKEVVNTLIERGQLSRERGEKVSRATPKSMTFGSPAASNPGGIG